VVTLIIATSLEPLVRVVATEAPQKAETNSILVI
jgi:hypothetical protein